MLTGSELPLADGLSREFLHHHGVCPIRFDADGHLVVATAPSADLAALEELALVYNAPVRVEPAAAHDVDRFVERLAATAERRIELGHADHDEEWGADVRNLAGQPPVVRYVNLLVDEAYRAGASDVHLEADRSGLSARFRVDGVLVAAPEPPAGLHAAVVSRVKLLAELDIAERRRPQDGRIRVRLEARDLDLRVSTVPTLFGESVVLRLLDRGGRPVALGELGMPEGVREVVASFAQRRTGMLLVTGPTGSGKTTTLYATLALRGTAAEKIVTVEDPVEYQLPGVAQVPVHTQAGVTFASALRSILRQDPDVVMVGEMRDPETAEIAIKAAMTGHVVFSTLHTNDAIGALPRLLDLGVPDYLVASTLDAVLAQRLVRRICERCVVEYVPDRSIAERVAEDGTPFPGPFLRGAGCPECRGTGYRGRLGVYQLLQMGDTLRAAVVRRASGAELHALAREAGLRSMRRDGWDKVMRGLTTVEEVHRVVPE